jgi:hypothetical protein
MTTSTSDDRRNTSKSLLNIILYTTCFIGAYRVGHYSRSNSILEEIKYLLDYSAVGGGSGSSHFVDNLHSKKNILPRGWESYTMDDVSNHFECDEGVGSTDTGSTDYDKSSTKTTLARSNRPLLSLQYWLLLRQQYKEFVDEKAVFDDPVPPTLGYSLSDHKLAPFYAAAKPSNMGSEIISRGLYASRDIKKGEIVHDRTLSESIFPDAITYRNYVLSLPRAMACDVMDWAAWTRPLNEDGPERYIISLSMNISSLIRSGDLVRANVRAKTSNSGEVFYATRDIKKDEEILTHYTRFTATITV